MTVTDSWSAETFVSSYLNIPLFLILYFGYKFVCKTKILALKDMQIRHLIDIANQNPEPAPKPKRGLMKLNVL